MRTQSLPRPRNDHSTSTQSTKIEHLPRDASAILRERYLASTFSVVTQCFVQRIHRSPVNPSLVYEHRRRCLTFSKSRKFDFYHRNNFTLGYNCHMFTCAIDSWRCALFSYYGESYCIVLRRSSADVQVRSNSPWWLPTFWCRTSDHLVHYSDVIISAKASQITRLTNVCSTVYSAQIKENIKALRHWPLWGWPVNSPHKWPVTRKMFSFDDVTMRWECGLG